MEAEDSLICLIDTRIESLHDEMAVYFVVEILIRNKASVCRRLERCVLKLKKNS
jgi:hypothetical protein